MLNKMIVTDVDKKELSMLDVRVLLRNLSYDKVLIVRHDIANIDRMLLEDRPNGNYDTILRANADNVEYVAIFEATNSQNAVLQRIYRYNGSEPESLGNSNFEWKNSLDPFPEPRLVNKLVIPQWTIPRSYCLKQESKAQLAYLCDGFKVLGDALSSQIEIVLSWNKLKNLYHQSHLYPDWKAALTSIDGVYLIRDTETGHEYVGTTWGHSGVWGRWEGYARTNHNGNVLLEKHVNKRGVNGLIITLLEFWERESKGQDDCIHSERMWKIKLKSRSSASQMGLNHN